MKVELEPSAMRIATTELEPRVLIVGAGDVGGELARRLSTVWRLTVVDLDEAVLNSLAERIDARRLKTLVGDGTSRLVLDRAGAGQVEHMVAATGSDEVNMEICRIVCEHFTSTRCHAVVADLKNIDAYREIGVEIVCPPIAGAIELEGRLLHGASTSLRSAESQGELVEVTVLHSSPVIGRTLSTLHSQRWHVAAIYRRGQLVVPVGQTVVEAGDHVLLTGEPEVLRSIAEFFRIGRPDFPLEFGSNVFVLTESSSYFRQIADEFRYFVNHIRSQQIEVLYWPHEPGIRQALEREIAGYKFQASLVAVFGSYSQVTENNVSRKDCGCLVVPDEKFRFLERIGFKRTGISGIIRSVESPVIFFRGSYPYSKILIPVADSEESMAAARVACDLARMFEASVTAVTVTSPRFIAGEDVVNEQKTALRKIGELADLYHVSISPIQVEGNPIEKVLEISQDYQLVVIAHRRNRRSSFFNPDISEHLLRRMDVTTLALPF